MKETIFGIENTFINNCLAIFPHEAQLDILQEECAELIQACSKIKRGKPGALDMIKEEMAHVLISSAMVAKVYGITEEDIAVEVKKKNDKYFDKNIIPKPEIEKGIHIEKTSEGEYVDRFCCVECGGPVVITSKFVDGSIYDYLCPKCWNIRNVEDSMTKGLIVRGSKK